MAWLFPGAVLKGYKILNLGNKKKALELHVDLEYGRFVVHEGGEAAIPLGIAPLNVSFLLGRPKRKWPFVFRNLDSQQWKVTIDPGEKWRIRKFPPGKIFLLNFLEWNLNMAVVDGKLRVEKSFLLKPGRVPPSEYPRVISICREILQAEKNKVILKRR